MLHCHVASRQVFNVLFLVTSGVFFMTISVVSQRHISISHHIMDNKVVVIVIIVIGRD